MTYTKANKTLKVYYKNSRSDSFTEPTASLVYSQWAKGEDLAWTARSGPMVADIEVPYHAIEYVEWTSESAETEKTDPYCVEG